MCACYSLHDRVLTSTCAWCGQLCSQTMIFVFLSPKPYIKPFMFSMQCHPRPSNVDFQPCPLHALDDEIFIQFYTEQHSECACRYSCLQIDEPLAIFNSASKICSFFLQVMVLTVAK